MLGVTGSCTFLESGVVTGATNAAPVVYTAANHGLASGFVITVAGVTGNAGANASGVVTVLTANTFSIAGSIGTGAYVSGGIWHMTGLYTYTFAVASASGFESGTIYVSVLEGTSGGISFSYTETFQVN